MIKVWAPVNDCLGYGVASVNFIKQMHEKSVEYSVFPKGGSKNISITESKFKESIEYGLSNFLKSSSDDPTLHIWHQHGLHERLGAGPTHGMTFFEVDEMSQQEIHSLKFCDKVIVSSNFQAGVLRKYDIDSDIVPLGVDEPPEYQPSSIDNKYIFLNVGKWEIRKRQNEIVQAFNSTFKDSDNVELWMMCESPFQDLTNIKQQYLSSPLGHKIKWIPRQKKQSKVMEIMQMAHCGVFPSSAEAWNLEILEMMSFGKQVIVSDYSGHKDFCNDDNSLLLRDLTKEVANDGKWFHGTGSWMKPSIEELGNKMKEAFSNGIVKNDQGIETARKFTWSSATNKLMDLLK